MCPLLWQIELSRHRWELFVGVVGVVAWLGLRVQIG